MVIYANASQILHRHCEIRNQNCLYGRYSYKIALKELQTIFTIGYNEDNSKSYAVIFVKSFHTLVMKGAFMLREPLTINPKKVEGIVAREEAEFRKRTPRSHEIHQRAKSSLPMGVSSSFQAVPPYPLFISSAEGSHIWDYDGNEYADFHLAF